MSRQAKLEEKLRNSQFLTQTDIFCDFLAYAKGVRDQQQVYEYMEEHEIGINHWEYWLARFQTMRTRCQFTGLVKLISQLKKKNRAIQPSDIAEYEGRLKAKMYKMYFRQTRGKRGAQQFNNRMEVLHPSTRKIGNIQMYVDQRCRHTYGVEDLSGWIERNMQDQCETQRNLYQQEQKRKPLSFIAKKQEYLMELTKQFLKRNSRKSQAERLSLGHNRLSNKINTSQKQFEAGNYNTPKSHQKESDSNDQQQELLYKAIKKPTKRTDSGRDSVQILKSMKEKKEQVMSKSPKFKSSKKTNSFDKLIEDPEQTFVPVQKCRSVMVRQEFAFSFGKSKSQRKSNVCLKIDENTKDNAFILHSLSRQTAIGNGNSFVQKQDFMLELMIKQIQRQAYEVAEIQTFSSQIGSNEENEQLNQDRINNNNYGPYKNTFETVYESASQEMRNHDNSQLQKLIDFDEDKPSESSGSSFIPAFQDSENKPNNSSGFTFLSEKKKRLTQINEQNLFLSESKGKHNYYE